MTSSWSVAKGRVALAGCALLVLSACGHGGAEPRSGDFRAASLAEGARLVVTTQGGVRIVGTDGDRVAVDDSVLAHGDGDGDTYTLDLPCDEGDARDDRARENCDGMPLVRVPSGVTLTVRARNAGIDVSGVRGGLSLSTVNGDITVQDSGAKGSRQHLVTRNGSVRATGLRGLRIDAETVNGDVDVRCATAPDTLSGVTRNGSARVTLPPGTPPYATEAHTVNGRSTSDLPAAERSDHAHRLTLRTVNGDTEVRQG
ncbi:DUF4097 family beta strand repeat-containing protein [Streptomyces sp. SID7909]|uniref:DUF4097 family beta strand repeat-containing protein n=1 Tax=Streptomyces sp. SID7909 TaxID=2706092 RepID=UPI0013BD32D7|nr:DUF4097 family beta strand repeat-containing protein [Streptomyces sp. SID7909]NEC06148.1 DUF4097 domain-containing protein [Streptomyces sp. SID7909]